MKLKNLLLLESKEILINPTKSEMLSLIKRKRNKKLRWIATMDRKKKEKRLFVSFSFSITHWEMEQKIQKGLGEEEFQRQFFYLTKGEAVLKDKNFHLIDTESDIKRLRWRWLKKHFNFKHPSLL